MREGQKRAACTDFEAVLRLPNCRFVDLQYGDTLIDRERAERALGVRVEHLDDIDNTRDIDGLAALISACDLVVTVSNTTAHLAGALGRPTFVMVPTATRRSGTGSRIATTIPSIRTFASAVRRRHMTGPRSWRRWRTKSPGAGCPKGLPGYP